MKSQKNTKMQSSEKLIFPEFEKIKINIQALSQIEKNEESLNIS